MQNLHRRFVLCSTSQICSFVVFSEYMNFTIVLFYQGKDTFYHLDCKSYDKAGGTGLNRGLTVLAWKIFLGFWSIFCQKPRTVAGLHILFYFKSKQNQNSLVFGQNFSQRTLPLVALLNFLSIRDTSFSHFCLGANIRRATPSKTC